jgi:hypothetical protein
MDLLAVTVDETQAASLRGVSAYTQRRHRLNGVGPKPIMSTGGKPRYRLRDIKAEQDTAAANERAA